MFSLFALIVFFLLFPVAVGVGVLLIARYRRQAAYRRQSRANLRRTVGRIAPVGRHAFGA